MARAISKLYGFRWMLLMMTINDLRGRYKDSALGFLWSLAHPLLLMGVYTLVFETIVQWRIENASVFLLANILPWQFFSNSLQGSARSIVSNAGLIKKVAFPHEVLTISHVLSNWVNLLLSLLVFVPFVMFFGVFPHSAMVYLPLVLVLHLVMVVGMSFIVASLTVLYRDLEHLLSIVLHLWFYLSPILYPREAVPHAYRLILDLNPMTYFINAYNHILYRQQPPRLLDLGIGFAFALGMWIVGYTLFNRLKPTFAEEL